MRYLYAVLLLSLACSAPQDPGTILDWAPVRAPPVPGVGLPKPRAPTLTPAAKPQPQPKPARHLPQTPETRKVPGIWAGDAPHASTRRAPDLLDVVFPLPDGIEPEHVPALAECGNVYGPIFKTLSAVLQHALNLEPEDRACLVDALLGDCLYRANAAKDGSVPPSVLRRIDARFNECYPRFGQYSTIIREVEAARKRNIKSTKGDH